MLGMRMLDTLMSDPDIPRTDRAAQRRAAIEDVAHAAGVSKSAVSKVVRQSPGVSKQMRERVTALGGTLDTSPRPCGGFSVRARIPLQGLQACPDGREDLADRAGPMDPAAVEAL